MNAASEAAHWIHPLLDYQSTTPALIVDRALVLLVGVVADAESLFKGLPGTARNHEKAQEVAVVFKEYGARLRALGLAPDGAGLTNTELDWVQLVSKCAREARTVLITADEDTSLALDRAYANGAKVE